MGYKATVTTKSGSTYQVCEAATTVSTAASYSCRFCVFKTAHAPALTQHEKVQHLEMLPSQRDFVKESRGLDVHMNVQYSEVSCEILDEDAWLWVDIELSFDIMTPAHSSANKRKSSDKIPPAARLGAIGRSRLGKMPPPTSENGRRGALKRHSYTYEEKANALSVLDAVILEKESGGVDNVNDEAAARTGIPAGNFSHWNGAAMRESIFKNAGTHKLKTLRKRKRTVTGIFPEMEEQLYSEFKDRRKKGRRCGPLWLSVRARQIIRAIIRTGGQHLTGVRDVQPAAVEACGDAAAIRADTTSATAVKSVSTDDEVCYVCLSATWGPEKHPINICSTCGLGWHHICCQFRCPRCTPDDDLCASKKPPAVTTLAKEAPSGVVAVVSPDSVDCHEDGEEEVVPTIDDKRALAFTGGSNWRRRFATRFRLATRKRTNNKCKSKGDRTEAILKWHEGYFKMLRGDNAPAHAVIDQKWGRFLPTHRINVDQSPLGFISGLQDTYDEKGAKEVWINTPSGSSLEKRQCTLQICYVSDAGGRPQIRLALIFRGKGLRISQLEREAWDKRVDVYFQVSIAKWTQEKAWADRDFSLAWLEGTFLPWAKELEGEKLLLMDNLDSQVNMEFRKKLKETGNTLAWFFEPNATDLLQPTDRHLAQLLKVLIAAELEKWLEDDDNLSKWESGALTASDRRVLLTFWSGEAYEKLWKKHIAGKSFDGTGCNLTIDLSELEKVQPQNMHQYSRELKKRLELALQNEQVVSADEIEANAMQVESAPAASGELKADSSEEECADDAYDSDNGEASDDETIEAAPFWVPEGMQSMPEMPELTKRLVGTYILFKWEVYGWQYGRVKKILARNNSGYNFKVYYRTEDREASHTLTDENYVGGLPEVDNYKFGSWVAFKKLGSS
ncbi:hypothetical protein CYMTET_45066 [Cymbomonas tetramitiformis]|uniref:DDE-1 domain-containing protein n=1 Tax=Cymbomonas tetramitiformis TaxID=36881 RepID=A0AAE0EYZ4_9CHLO|nr:hypothetical protein CYMTET_45066 [Cymbomonas tetramitiformis]